MTKLMLHAGGWTANREELEAVPIPPRTWSYTPIAHNRIVEALHDLIPQNHMKIEREQYALAKDGNRMFGVFDITNGNGKKDWTYSLGFRNSYDRSMTFSLVGGSRVFVCDNLAFHGDIQITRRHTGVADKELVPMCKQLLLAFNEKKIDIAEFIETMKMSPITDVTAHDYVCRAVRDGVLPTSHVSRVLDQWYEPKHEEFAPRSKWSLYNAFTEIAKDRTAGLQVNSTVGLTALMKG